jgi:hypothetical protein
MVKHTIFNDVILLSIVAVLEEEELELGGIENIFFFEILVLREDVSIIVQ